jgi:hypothetical protein
MDAAQLHELAMRIKDDPQVVYDLKEDEVQAASKYLKRYGGAAVFEGQEVYANISVCNMREKRMKRELMTAMIGYLQRVRGEYQSPEELREIDNFNANMQRVKNETKRANMKAAHEAALKQIRQSNRDVIDAFLHRAFEYNPDIHVREAAAKKTSSGSGVTREQLLKQYKSKLPAACNTEASIANNADKSFAYLRERFLDLERQLSSATKAIRGATTSLQQAAACIEVARENTTGGTNSTSDDRSSAAYSLQDASIAAAQDQLAIANKHWVSLIGQLSALSEVVTPLQAADTLAALQIMPPAELFHHFDRYFANHYEQIRTIVNVMYAEPSDIEFVVQLYSSHKNKEAAKRFLQQHSNDLVMEAFTIKSGRPTLLGPFKENRERVEYYSKETQVIRDMLDQVEADHKLGHDIMRKQVKSKKQLNIEEAGPDNPMLREYSGLMNEVQAMGTKAALTKEEREEMERKAAQAKIIKEEYETPPDAICVDMHVNEIGEDGEQKIVTRRFHTQAEVPLHLQKDSEYANAYQPVRPSGMTVEESLQVTQDDKSATLRVNIEK